MTRGTRWRRGATGFWTATAHNSCDEHRDRLRDVLEAPCAEPSQVSVAEPAGRHSGCLRDQELAGRGLICHAGSDVDGCAPPVPAALDGHPGVNARVNSRESVPAGELTVNAQAQLDRLSRARSPHHHGVADPLDHLGTVLRCQRRHRRGEFDCKLGRRLVADPLRDRGIATEIGEKEALKCVFGHSVN
jgi:hypothetical protein